MVANSIAGSVQILMPRGRGWKRGAVSSKRGQQGVSTTTTGQVLGANRSRSRGPLRRSARLAEAVPQSVLASRAAEAAHSRQLQRQRSRRARVLEDEDSPIDSPRRRRQPASDRVQAPVPITAPAAAQSLNTYSLRINNSPSTDGYAGQSLGRGLGVEVSVLQHATNLGRNDMIFGRLFVVATLIDADTDRPLPQAELRTRHGQGLAQTVRAVSSEAIANNGIARPGLLGRVSFPDIVISEPGTYRLRLALMRVGSANGNPLDDSGAMSMTTVETTKITIA
jgi:hypothetical protein